jgi:thiosulfate/3-mercaptopyruvate sulfurtransferase
VGHLAGARQLQWEELFADGATQLKPRAELERLFAERVRPGDAVVTYCWVGYRASATWFIAQWLGYDARLYDGSYQDWSQRALPTRAGTTP